MSVGRFENLKLRKKTIIAIFAVIICLFTLISSISYSILMTRFSQIERKNTEQNVIRALNTLQDKISTLNRFDWSNWDDTYAFIQDANEAYIENNLITKNFVDLKLNVMLFINTSGQVVYGKAIDLQNATDTPVPQSLLDCISANESLWRHTNIESSVAGIILLPENPMLISSKPILTSQSLGPIRGALLIGRFIDSEELETWSQITRLPLTLYRLDESHMTADFQVARSSLSDQTPIFANPLNADSIAGYGLIKDVGGSPILVLRADMPRDIFKQGQESISYLVASLICVGLVFGAVSLLLLEKFVLSRLMRLDNDVKSISRSQSISKRLEVRGDDELSSLGISVNVMLDSLEQSQKLAAIGELTTMVAHDLRNPLQGISNTVYYLKNKFGSKMDEKTSRMFNLVQNDIEYSDKILRDLLDFSSEIRLELNETTLAEIAKESFEMTEVPENVKVVNSAAKEFTIKVDKQKMKRVFVNIIRNAIEAMPRGGTFTVAGWLENGNLEVAFTDTGIGIPVDVVEKVGKPLFTTKAKGMGLGFAICKRVIEAHGGKISIESAVGKGTTVRVKLPVESESEERGEKVWVDVPESLLSTMKKA